HLRHESSHSTLSEGDPALGSPGGEPRNHGSDHPPTGRGRESGGLSGLLQDGTLHSVSRQGSELVCYASSEDAARKLEQLGRSKGPGGLGVLARARELLVPPNLPENCAPEYLKFRAWCLGSAVAGGAIGFMNVSVTLDALKIAFDTTEKAAMAQTINTFLGRFCTMGASFLAQKGDADPRKFFLMGSMMASVDAVLTLGVLSAYPHAYWPLTAGITMAGAVAGCLGGAAGVNLFNHMAKGPNKGLVASKNANQDLVAGMLGMPVALGLGRAAEALGVNPHLFTVATMGPVLALCTLQAAGSIRMESLTRANLERMADHYQRTGTIPEAPRRGMWGTMACLFESEDKAYSGRIQFSDSLDDVVGQDQQLFSVFRQECYLLNFRPGGLMGGSVKVALKKDAGVDDALKAYTQARMIEKALDSGLYALIEKHAPGRAPLTLVELTHRALPQELKVSDTLVERGWHGNPAALKVARLEDVEWTGPERPPMPPITRDDFNKLVETKDEQALKRFLNTPDDLPLFAPRPAQP
ncbi:MAG: RUS1 family protein, partial [Candidatus Eremiobacterota bacterium]